MASDNAAPAGGTEVKTEYVLSGQPTGWAAMAKEVRDVDEEKMNNCKDDVDTLLVFVSACHRKGENVQLMSFRIGGGWSIFGCIDRFPCGRIPQSTAQYCAADAQRPRSHCYADSKLRHHRHNSYRNKYLPFPSSILSGT